MEEQRIADKVPVEEQVSENFICPVCLEILYKPIVLCCGHIACFWCVHKSMKRYRESHCPICRHPYVHFPFICEMFHLLLLKIYPVAYKRRGDQIFEEEKIIGLFSPQFNALRSDEEESLNHLVSEAYPFLKGSQSKVCLDSQLGNEQESCAEIKQSESRRTLIDNSLEKGPDRKLALKGKNYVNAGHKVTVDDVLCLSCEQVLFRPVVLNCGHVYCEVCIMKPTELVLLKCQVCESVRPRSFPKVCLELDNFLKEQFPKDYAARGDDVNRVILSRQNSTNCSTNADQGGLRLSCGSRREPSPRGDNNLMIHSGVGCDSCGMSPIAGERYKCKDCVERIGFDLCGDCYRTRSKLPGRFNQRHTPEHKFELVKANSLKEIMLALVSGQLHRAAAIFPTNPADNPPLASSSPLTVEFPYAADLVNHGNVFPSSIPPPPVAEENAARENGNSLDSPNAAEDA